MGLSRNLRETPPAHYTVKVDSFSLISNTKLEKYESGIFEVGSYKWKLCLYPNGDARRGGKDHISLFLTIAETDMLPVGWEVNVNLKMFVFNHNQDKYLTIQDEDGKVWRYHNTKTEWGFSKLLSLKELNDTDNGYLYNDSFVFGVEAFILENTGKGETLSRIDYPEHGTYTWKIYRFPSITRELIESPEFVIGGHKWILTLWPKGIYTPKGEKMSLFLKLTDAASLTHGRKLYVEYKLRTKNQIGKSNFFKQASHWFTPSSSIWGYSNFTPLSDINDISKGFLLNDTIILEAQFLVMSHIEDHICSD